MERYLEVFIIVWLRFAEMSVNESPALCAFLHLLFTSVHCCNSLEAHLLPRRFAGIGDGPFHIKADRKPGNRDGAQVRQYNKADLHSLASTFFPHLYLQLFCEIEKKVK